MKYKDVIQNGGVDSGKPEEKTLCGLSTFLFDPVHRVYRSDFVELWGGFNRARKAELGG